ACKPATAVDLIVSTGAAVTRPLAGKTTRNAIRLLNVFAVRRRKAILRL
ncbi:6229_t:CDS:1, partial [Paraglomus occultum]